MVPAQAEGGRSLSRTRSGAFEIVSYDGATRGGGGLCGLDDGVDAAAVERRKPAGLHQIPLAIDQELVEHGERGAKRRRLHRADEHRPKAGRTARAAPRLPPANRTTSA